MANGRVITGFSSPKVAVYSATGTNVSYASNTALARGVNVEISPEVGDDNIFYADNVAAENSAGTFTGGTLKLTVDGLKDEARKLIYGLPTPTKVTVDSKQVDVYDYDDDMEIPYVGVGFVVRMQSDGVVEYVPMVLTKCRFKIDSTSAETQGESISWQTSELEATIMRDDSAKHRWKRVGVGQTSEAEAIAVIDAILGATS